MDRRLTRPPVRGQSHPLAPRRVCLPPFRLRRRSASCARQKVNAHGGIMYTLLIAEIAIILAWPVLLCRKLDGTISTSWMVVWTPMWIVDAVGQSSSG